ncbi:MAG: PhoU domain-containing protein [Thermoleophilia bacterium]
MGKRSGIEDGTDDLRNGMIEVSSVIVGQVEQAVNSWEARDLDGARRVIAGDDDVDDRCAALERLAFDLVLLQAPKAHDLRFIHSGLIVTVALERVGDLAVAIARRVDALEHSPMVPEVEALIRRMEPRAIGALSQAVQAFAREDTEMAIVAQTDAHGVLDLLEEVMAAAARPNGGDGSESWLAKSVLLARHLERVANNAAEISGRVRFVANGGDPA